jgi:hypothetical protein
LISTTEFAKSDLSGSFFHGYLHNKYTPSVYKAQGVGSI